MVLGLVPAVIVLAFFLLPVVPMTVTYPPCKQCVGGAIPESASASMSYSSLGAGVVLVPNQWPSTGHTYCWLSGDGESGTTCGYAMERL